jgi:hypothetical protein
VLKNIEPTPIYKLINSRVGTKIDRITLDFDIKEYLKNLSNKRKIKPIIFNDEDYLIRMYIDIFLRRGQAPYMITYFTLKNLSSYNLVDLSMYFIFDFDINGLKGFDTDLSGYDNENDIIYQYDETGLHAGFSTISKSTYYESCLTRDFKIDSEKLNLSNKIFEGYGEILSALQIGFKTLEPQQSFQTAIVLSGGDTRKDLIENIKNGKINAMKNLGQVYRSVRSEQRNIQEEAFIKLNQQQSQGCKD